MIHCAVFIPEHITGRYTPNGILEFKVNVPEDELIRFNHRLLLKTEENQAYFAEGLKALITI